MQYDVGAAAFLANGFDGEVALSGALPADCLVWAGVGPARDQRHPVCDDERGVEANAKLADERRVPGGVGRQALEELACPRFRNRTDVLDDFLAGQPDAV